MITCHYCRDAKYSVGVWSTESQAYVPHESISDASVNISLSQLKATLKQLRKLGYLAHRKRSMAGDYDDNDWKILVERTDGKSASEILDQWRR